MAVPYKYEIDQVIGDIRIIDCFRKIASGKNCKCYEVRCEVCGTLREMLENRITRRDGIYHGTCKKYLYKYSIGQFIGDVVIEELCRDTDSHKAYVVRCNICGRTRQIRERRIDEGVSIWHSACGYGEKEKGSKLHNIWAGLKQRITYENHVSFHRYGGRGLELGFSDFLDFHDYVIEMYLEDLKYYGVELSIERIDIDIGYVKGNIRFIPMDLQQDNTSRTVYFRYTTPNGEIGVDHNLSAFARKHAIPEHIVKDYVYGKSSNCYGYEIERITKKQHDFEQLMCNKLAGIPIERLEQMAAMNDIPVPQDLSISELISRIARWATDERMSCGA